MKVHRHIYLIAAAVIPAVTFRPAPAAAQNRNSEFMEYRIDGNDTIYISSLKASKIFRRMPRQKGKDWRKYYRLVHNFNKVYPYALESRNIIRQVDSTISADELRKGKKERYIKGVQSKLFDAYEKDFRSMTVSQGALLMRLIDRECGISSYDIIKDYRNGIAAGFWQGIAKMFGSDMKRRYDPDGEDAQIEELVRIWEDGDYDSFYYSLFWEWPSHTEIKPDVASKRR